MSFLNLNDTVRVRLTDHGREIHRADYHATPTRAFWFPYSPPREDADGWSDWLIWELMQLFGPHLSMVGPLPFECDMLLPTTQGNPGYQIRLG